MEIGCKDMIIGRNDNSDDDYDFTVCNLLTLLFKLGIKLTIGITWEQEIGFEKRMYEKTSR